MDKSILKNLLVEKHIAFIEYMQTLNDDELSRSADPKWSAGQQLNHIVICVKSLLKAFGTDKLILEQRFGLSNRVSLSYDAMESNYLEKLKEGGKAPAPFVPEAFLLEQKTVLISELEQMIKDLCLKLENFSEEELDALCLPHPLLGNITLREMLYNTIQHVEHHHNQTQLNLTK